MSPDFSYSKILGWSFWHRTPRRLRSLKYLKLPSSLSRWKGGMSFMSLFLGLIYNFQMCRQWYRTSICTLAWALQKSGAGLDSSSN